MNREQVIANVKMVWEDIMAEVSNGADYIGVWDTMEDKYDDIEPMVTACIYGGIWGDSITPADIPDMDGQSWMELWGEVIYQLYEVGVDQGWHWEDIVDLINRNMGE